MYCRNCGEVMNDNQAICLKCGVKTGEGKVFALTAVMQLLKMQQFVLAVALLSKQQATAII